MMSQHETNLYHVILLSVLYVYTLTSKFILFHNTTLMNAAMQIYMEPLFVLYNNVIHRNLLEQLIFSKLSGLVVILKSSSNEQF